MDAEVTLFTKPEELIAWADTFDILLNPSIEDAAILLNYMEGHDYAIGIDSDGKMYRQDVAEENGEIEPYPIDDVIDTVCEWNYELILDADAHRNDPTTPKDLVCDEDVKIVLYILAESVAARLRENGFRCRVVEISVRDNELFSFTRQKKIDHATNITGEIAAYAYQIFKENYNWSKPIRSVGVRGADLVTDNYWEQIDLFSSVEKREKQMKMDSAVDEIRRRFGFYSIQRGLMYRDRILSAVNAKEEHTVHPHGYFSG